MGAPWQVRVTGCAIGLALLPIIVGFDGAHLRAGTRDAGPPCVDPSELARSVVSLVWFFDKARLGDAGRDVVGQRATAWFYTSPRLLVTANHFAAELPEGWQDAELRQAGREGKPDRAARVRLRVMAEGAVSERDWQGRRGSVDGRPALAEDIAILELQEPFPNAQILEVEAKSPSTNSTVLIMGYPGGKMQAVLGTVRTADDLVGRYSGLELIEVQGSNRLLLGHGASGAPVLDCRGGRVVAVLNGLLTGPSLPLLPPEHSVIPTPWGSPTNTAVPVSTLVALPDRSR